MNGYYNQQMLAAQPGPWAAQQAAAQVAQQNNRLMQLGMAQASGLAQMGMNQGSGFAGQQNAYNQMAAQYQMQQAGNSPWSTPTNPEWMIDGQSVSKEEFINIIFPEDTPEKTMFILKHTKITNEEMK